MTWNLIGNAWAADMLQEHIRRQTVRHAYLISGPSGVGRRTLALKFAQALNCLQPPEPGQACGECRICRQTAAMQQADLSVVQVAEDASAVKIEQIREVQRSLSLAPYEARLRVALLLNFDRATIAAQNALLKTLEEAPERAILILTASDPENLLATIVSRCEVLRLRPLAPADLAAVLQTHSAAVADSALRYACLSGGRPGLALTYLQNPDLLAERTQWLDNLVDCLPANRLTRFKLAEVYSKDKDTLRQILAAWLVYWRDIMLAAAGANTPLTNVDRQEEIRALAARCGFTQACNMVQRLDATLENLDANLNARLLLEVLLLDMPYLN